MAISAILACIVFLIAYGVFHALHLVRREPAFLLHLSSIPLFFTFLGSAILGIAVGALGGLIVDDLDLVRRLPAALGVATIGLAAEIILFP